MIGRAHSGTIQLARLLPAAGAGSSSLQSLVDLSPTFLDAVGIEIPGVMQGLSQRRHWRGGAEAARSSVIVENRHQPTSVHLRTYIEQRYKVTVYRGHEFGELYDLVDDPNERHNLWDDPESAQVKNDLLHRFLNAELEREPTRFQRISVAKLAARRIVWRACPTTIWLAPMRQCSARCGTTSMRR